MSVTLITGCSSGLGLALAHALREAGHDVWATTRRDADVATLVAAGFNAYQLDVNEPEQCVALAQQLTARGKGLDVLINNAGSSGPWPRLPTPHC